MGTSETPRQSPVDVADGGKNGERWMIWGAVMRAMRQVRPDTDLEELSRFESIVEEAELEPFEFEQLIAAVADESGIRVPESDYPLVGTLDGLERYLIERVSPST
jgi:acyl carrier protein